jgi:ADP-ribosylglycohydrolase
MLGAIAGDVIGSVYEGRSIKTKQFQLFDRHADFTDDTVLTVATAYAILQGIPYGEAYKQFGRAYPGRGYGANFQNWVTQPGISPYGSFGNGSAMRAGPVGWAFQSMAKVLAEAEKSAACTHNHMEGIKGAQAAALGVYLARRGAGKADIRTEIEVRFDYDLHRNLSDIRKDYGFDISCQGSVPEAIIAFLESTSYEDTLRNAVSLGGDTDTQACIAGAIAEAYYITIPMKIASFVKKRLDETILRIIRDFSRKYNSRLN